MQKFLKPRIWFLFIFSFACILLNPLGEWFWVVDLFTNFLPQQIILFVTCGIYLIWLRWKKFALKMGVAFVMVLLGGNYWDSILIRLQGNTPIEANAIEKNIPLKIISFNVLTHNKNKAEVLSWLESQIQPGGEFIFFLMEVDDAWIKALQPLKEKMKYSKEVPRDDNFGIAMYASIPLAQIQESEFDSNEIPAFTGSFQVGSQSFSFFGVHPLPPLGKDRFDQRNQYLDHLNTAVLTAPYPSIVVGDFNCSPWSPNIRRVLRNKADHQLVDPFSYFFRSHTWGVWGVITTSIDYILIPKKFRVGENFIGPSLGSDHRPVAVSILVPRILL